MDIVRSLFKNNLRRLKLNQKDSYILTDFLGSPLTITLELQPSNEILDSLHKAFSNCKFNRVDLILEFDDNKIKCLFINLDAINYNPFEDHVNIKLININLMLLKTNPGLLIEQQQFKISTINIPRHRHISAKSKYELLQMIEKMITMFLKYYDLNASQRLAVYENDCNMLVVDISLITAPNNELFLDELYFFYILF